MKAATTLPRLLHRNAVEFRHPSRLAREARRHLAGAELVGLRPAGFASRRRSCRTWIWPRRQAGGDRRQPAAPLCRDAGRAVAWRRGCAAVARCRTGLDRAGTERCRRVDRRRRGRRAGGQDRRGQGSSVRASACRADGVARHAPTRARLAEIVRIGRRCGSRRDRAERAGRSCVAALRQRPERRGPRRNAFARRSACGGRDADGRRGSQADG